MTHKTMLNYHSKTHVSLDEYHPISDYHLDFDLHMHPLTSIGM